MTEAAYAKAFVLVLFAVGCSRGAERSPSVPLSTRDSSVELDGDKPGVVRATAQQVVVGFRHSCALLSDGTVRCWGLGAEGRLGLGDTRTVGDDEVPAAVPPVNLGGRAIAIAAGDAHTCALLETKQVVCWGLGRQGQLGHGEPNSIGDDEAPAKAGPVPLDDFAKSIAAAGNVSCAVVGPSPEGVRCWGENANGALGYGDDFRGDLGDDESIKVVLPLRFPTDVTQLTFPCALLANGDVHCWDGSGDSSQSSTVDLGGDISRLAFADVGCMVTKSKRARCWAAGSAFGGEAVIRRGTPDLVELPFVDVEDVSVANDHGCVVLRGGAVRCWGEQRLGMLGTPDGPFVASKDAVAVDVGAPASSVVAGNARTCVVTVAGGIRCWGSGRDGQLGYGNVANVGQSTSPASVGDVPL